jgi:hypothetical protein
MIEPMIEICCTVCKRQISINKLITEGKSLTIEVDTQCECNKLAFKTMKIVTEAMKSEGAQV